MSLDVTLWEIFLQLHTLAYTHQTCQMLPRPFPAYLLYDNTLDITVQMPYFVIHLEHHLHPGA